jgi:hypothetical protein
MFMEDTIIVNGLINQLITRGPHHAKQQLSHHFPCLDGFVAGIRAQMAQGVLAKLGYANVVNGMTWIQVQETIDQLPQ